MRLLRAANGVEAYGGYFRLFGVGPRPVRRHARAGTTPASGSSAWGDRADGWLCSRRDRLGRPVRLRGRRRPVRGDPTVYRLDAFRLEPEPIAACFGDFLAGEFARNAAAPRDEMMVEARLRFGDLEPSRQLAYVPPLLAGGDEDLANVVELVARDAMTLAGETHSALTAA